MLRSPFPALLSVTALTLNLVAPGAIAQPVSGTIVSTGDGDTLRVNQNGQTITIRLACIDSPEASQPGGEAAANRLRQLLPQGQAVQVIPVDADRYGRTVGVVFANGRSVNLQLVQEGYAVVYQQFLSNCPNSRNELIAAENQAKAARRNFWAQANPVMPWDWRQGQRPAPSSSGRSAPAQPAANFPPCVNLDCDCGDFASQAEAQRVFNFFPGDPFRLDRDGDGRVCEGR
ncbi:thermonuclease family protein [Leptolyngbya sp. GB1-A1]|uniref:thermonuclease family protein n=1 Tax=Leptolyngbya sp. GB1-A1 TaxID=2933908 RepID=UPI00329A2FF5